MAAATLNTQTIAIVNGQVALMQALAALSDQANQLVNQYYTLTLSTPLGALPTYTPIADGTIPPTNDATPNPANPINPNEPNTAGLTRGNLSSGDYASINTFLLEFVNLVTGAAVVQQNNAPALFAKIENG